MRKVFGNLIRIAIIISIFLIRCIELQAQAQIRPHINLINIDRIVSSYANNHAFNGIVTVADKGKIVYSKGYGFANIENKVPVSPSTYFNIGSITKSFTALAILLLQDKGKLNINDKLNKLVPSIPHGDSITVYNLLNHSSGLPDFLRQPNFFEITGRQDYATLKDVLPLFINYPLNFTPGTRTSYSNSNYVLLAHIIEVISGKPYFNFLREDILNPENITTIVDYKPGLIINNRANGYGVKGANEYSVSNFFNYSTFEGAGSLFATPSALVKWLRVISNRRILSSDSYDCLFGKPASDKNSLTWKLDTLEGHPSISATGWDGVGFSADVIQLTSDDISIVVLGNLNISSVTKEIARKICTSIINNKTQPLIIVKDKSKDLRQYAGDYQLGKDFYVPDLKLTFIVKENHLMEVQSNGNLVAVLQTGDNEFTHRSSWGKIVFNKSATGVVDGLTFFGYFKAKKL